MIRFKIFLELHQVFRLQRLVCINDVILFLIPPLHPFFTHLLHFCNKKYVFLYIS